MLIDARQLASEGLLSADVCVVGGGAAGITLARELAGSKLSVLVLEGGGTDYDDRSQELYKGRIVGLPYHELDVARLRYFGGTLNHWGGYCRGFDALDFEPRAGRPDSGWPIRKTDLDPYYVRAHKTLKLGEPRFDFAYWAGKSDKLGPDFSGEAIEATVLQKSEFGADTYDAELRQAGNIRICLNANVTEIMAGENARAVTGIRFRAFDGPERIATAKHYVLAAGGIENARLLLNSDRVQAGGLGNGNGLVGRYFMDHLGIHAGQFHPSSVRFNRDSFFEWQDIDGTKIKENMIVAEEVRRRDGMLRTLFNLTPGLFEANPAQNERIGDNGINSLKLILGRLRRFELPSNLASHIANVVADLDEIAALGYRKVVGGKAPAPSREDKPIGVLISAEPSPDPDSRVSLTDERDALGLRRIQLDWRVRDSDIDNVRRALKLLAAEFGRHGLGRIQLPAEDLENWRPPLVGHFHHIGTTRMSDDPARGVVDANCRMHTVENLYVAGSSVFPTAGSGTPTLTIVALATRLADHLKDAHL